MHDFSNCDRLRSNFAVVENQQDDMRKNHYFNQTWREKAQGEIIRIVVSFGFSPTYHFLYFYFHFIFAIPR